MLRAIGLTLDTATVVVILAMAAMGLNVLVGTTGLVSFGHSAWFGIGGYAAALAQLHWFKGQFVLPLLFSVAFIAALALVVGLPDPAPARRVLLAADAGPVRADIRDRLSLDGAHRRRGRAGRHRARRLASCST